MPNSYVVVDHGRLVLECWTGNVTHDELISHERTQLKDRSIKPGAAVLAYAVDATFETPSDMVHEVSDLYDSSDNPLEKLAVVVNDDTYDRAQLFSAQSVGFGISIVVFNDVESACAWLDVDPVKVKKQLRDIGT